MKELYVQRRVAEIIKEHGGYAKKWSSTYSVGVPDLVCVIPEVAVLRQGLSWKVPPRTVFVEVKMLDAANTDKFRRKVPATVRQRIEISKLNRAGARAVVLVLINEKHVVVLQPDMHKPLEDIYIDQDTPRVGWNDKPGILAAISGNAKVIEKG